MADGKLESKARPETEGDKHLKSSLTAEERKAIGMVDEPVKVEEPKEVKPEPEKVEPAKQEVKEEVKPKEEVKEKKVNTVDKFDEIFKLKEEVKGEENKAPLTEDERKEYLELKRKTETEVETKAIESVLADYTPEEAAVINEGLNAIVGSKIYDNLNAFDPDTKGYILVALAEKRMKSNLEKVKAKIESKKEELMKAEAKAKAEVKTLGNAETKGNESNTVETDDDRRKEVWKKAKKGDKDAIDRLIAGHKPING